MQIDSKGENSKTIFLIVVLVVCLFLLSVFFFFSLFLANFCLFVYVCVL